MPGFPVWPGSTLKSRPISFVLKTLVLKYGGWAGVLQMQIGNRCAINWGQSSDGSHSLNQEIIRWLCAIL
jgi:hypothetical protein